MDESLSTPGSTAAKVFLSGRAGCAIIQNAGSFFRISIDEIEPTPCDATYWSHLRGLHPDGVVLKAGEHPFLEAQRALRSSWQRDRALSLALIALDTDHQAELRRRACTAAEPLIAEPDAGAFLRSRLLSRVPPPDADFEGAKRLAEQTGARRMSQLFAEVDASRSAIVAVRTAWDRLARALPTPADRLEAMQVVERTGAVARLVVAVRGGMSPVERSALLHWLSSAVVPAVQWSDPLALLERWLNEVSPKDARIYMVASKSAVLLAHEDAAMQVAHLQSARDEQSSRGAAAMLPTPPRKRVLSDARRKVRRKA